MTLSSEQFHTLYDGAAQPVILVRDGAVAELNCHAQELFAVGTALRAYLPQDAALPEMLYARPAVLPVMAGGVCVSANTQPLDDALLLFLPPQDTRDELAAFCRAAQSISTPLTTLLSVSGTLFPLLSEAEDPAVQQNLAVLNRACYQLLRASENLTDLSYVQHGRLPLSLEKTDLTDFLDGLAQRADELCRQMGLALEADLPQAPIFVWIDRRQVRRALLALLSNAVKFSAPGGTLHLTLTRHGRRAVIRLSDSGEGMDAEILCSAFYRYARPEVPEDSRFGAGFSLPVVQATSLSRLSPTVREESFFSRKAVAGLSHISTTSLAWAISTPAGSSWMPFSSSTFRMASPRPTRMISTPYSRLAWTAPITGAWGALSPPMASTMIFIPLTFFLLLYQRPGLVGQPQQIVRRDVVMPTNQSQLFQCGGLSPVLHFHDLIGLHAQNCRQICLSLPRQISQFFQAEPI